MQNNHRYLQAKRVTFWGVLENVVLGLLKVVFGIVGHSQGLLADGIHSFSDLLTDVLVITASKAGSLEPDREHPYGHGRIETFATIVLAVILSVVGAWIIYESAHNILHQHFIKPDWMLLVIALISVVVNEFFFRYTLRAGHRIRSNLLIANAWHKRSDALSSLVVLVGLSGEMMGFHYFDSVAAIIVGAMIIKMGGEMTWASIRELIDTGVNDKTQQELLDIILKVPGVISAHQLRTRQIAGAVFVDVHVQVSPNISVSEGHFISRAVQRKLIKDVASISDVTIHIDSEDDEKVYDGFSLLSRKEILKTIENICQDFPCYGQIEQINLHYIQNSIELEIILPIACVSSETERQSLINQYQAIRSHIKDISKIIILFKV